MDFSSILTTLWGKISKPVPNVLIGIVFLYFAPNEIRWFGFIFLAIGVSSILDWTREKCLTFCNNYKMERNLKEIFSSMNNGEKRVMTNLLTNNEQTISINYNDYHRPLGAAPKGGRHEYVELFGICTGLQSKGIFIVATLEEITSFSVLPEAWKTMKKLHKKTPNIFVARG